MTGTRSHSVLGALLAALLSAACSSGPPEAAAEEPMWETERERLQRIDQLLGDTAARSPAERKIDSLLLYEIKRRSGDLPAEGPRSGIAVDPDGMTPVDVTAEPSDDLLARFEALGGTEMSILPQYQVIRAYMPIHQVVALAGSPEVTLIKPTVRAVPK